MSWTIKHAFVLAAVVSGASVPAQAAGIGSWSDTIQLPNIPSSAAVLANGRVLTWTANNKNAFEGDVGDENTATVTSIYNLSSGTISAAPDTGMLADMFCSGIAVLPDGRILVNGGSSSSHTGIYDYTTNSWASDAPMNIARGYNGSVTLSTGDVFTIGGSWSGDGSPKDGEVWSARTGWRQTTISVDAIIGVDISDVALGYIAFGDTHPWLFAMPNGWVFHAGPSPQMNWFDTTNESSASAGLRGDDTYAINGFAVMYRPGKILKAGGALTYTGQYDPILDAIPASDAAYVIDITADYVNQAAVPVVHKVAPMLHPRAFANSVVLPDGTVLIVGGQTSPHIFFDDNSVMTPELWNPVTETSVEVATMRTPRNYHSVALLLPDGRVFSGGGGLCGDGCENNHPDFELYSPPYLFAADGVTPAVRPVLTTVPTDLVLGGTLAVTVDRPVTGFSFIRMAASTHVINTDQRYIPLVIAGSTATTTTGLLGTPTTTTTYTLTVPSDPGITVPGLYMVFALDASGVPSIGKIVRVEPT